MAFKKIAVEDLMMNPFTKMGKEWMLITAGNETTGINTMTASWGGVGVLWNKNVATAYIRPQRYTKKFVDENDYFTLSFYDLKDQKALAYLGRVSGKDEDKIAHVGFHSIINNNYGYFDEATMVLVCKKLYHAPILASGFVEKDLDQKNYPNKDYHEMYIGEIVEVFVKE